MSVLTVTIEDALVRVTVTGGADWDLPLGPDTLVRRELEGIDPPGPTQLTNALATVNDHFEDVLNASPEVLMSRSVVLAGEHAEVLARVEIGADAVPAGYRLRRADAEEVFRTLVAEPADERRFNPGLPIGHVDTVIGTCCVVLAVMRRLDLAEVAVEVGSRDRPRGGR